MTEDGSETRILVEKKRLGVIGGLGPLATAYFFELVIQMTDAKADQEHVEILIYNRPAIPDRTSYILGKSKENPLPCMIETGQWLVGQGAEVIAIPCITAHYFHRELEEAIKAPVIHIVRETATHLETYGIKKAGIMATDGTIKSGLFQKELEACAIDWAVPDKRNQQYVMDLIYQDVKAGRPIEKEKFDSAVACLKKQGAEVIILGCTELSLIKREYAIGAGYLDAMEILARQAVLDCLADLKGEYQCLITGYQEKRDSADGNVS